MVCGSDNNLGLGRKEADTHVDYCFFPGFSNVSKTLLRILYGYLLIGVAVDFAPLRPGDWQTTLIWTPLMSMLGSSSICIDRFNDSCHSQGVLVVFVAKELTTVTFGTKQVSFSVQFQLLPNIPSRTPFHWEFPFLHNFFQLVFRLKLLVTSMS